MHQQPMSVLDTCMLPLHCRTAGSVNSILHARFMMGSGGCTCMSTPLQGTYHSQQSKRCWAMAPRSCMSLSSSTSRDMVCISISPSRSFCRSSPAASAFAAAPEAALPPVAALSRDNAASSHHHTDPGIASCTHALAACLPIASMQNPPNAPSLQPRSAPSMGFHVTLALPAAGHPGRAPVHADVLVHFFAISHHGCLVRRDTRFRPQGEMQEGV